MFTVKWSISYGIPFIAVFSSHGIRWRPRGVMPCCSPRGFFRSQRLWRALARGKSLEAGESVVQCVESLCWWILCSSWSKWSWSVSDSVSVEMSEMSNFDISMEEHEVWNLPILFVGEVPTDLPISMCHLFRWAARNNSQVAALVPPWRFMFIASLAVRPCARWVACFFGGWWWWRMVGWLFPSVISTWWNRENRLELDLASIVISFGDPVGDFCGLYSNMSFMWKLKSQAPH